MNYYTVKLSENQLKLISEATDLLQRVQLGQWREIEDSLPLQNPVNWDEFHNDMKIIGEILSKHLVGNINGLNSSLGVGNENLPKSNGVLYDLHRCIRYKLAMEKAVEQGIIESESSPRKWPLS